jgi:HD-GYP domain-containing protein (c-di-GMP phosphodiesterase class II)
MLGSSIGMNARELRDLRIAAMLHDVGKILVPAEALRKEGPLSTTETSAVRRHAVFGGMILRKIPVLAFAAPVARWHHERWDGLGYPDGIHGAAIPLHARVVAVADALDAMVSVRPYRQAMGLQEAFAELEAQSGAQFDPLIVSATGPLVGAPGFESSVAEIAQVIEVLPAAA